MTRVEKIIIACLIAIAASAMFFAFTGCGGNEEVIIDIPNEPTEVKAEEEDPQQPYCGDWNCDEKEGENYWNCLDCVDMNGWPKNGYCGDGICYKESMTSCWKDCRPRQVNNGQDDDFPWGPSGGGGPLPDPPFGPIDPSPNPPKGPGGKLPNIPQRGF